MKKVIFFIFCFSLSELTLAAPMGKLPIMVSRANCNAITPVGVGYHNESLSYYTLDKEWMWVKSVQRPKNSSVKAREHQSAWGYKHDWRVYAGFVDHWGTTAAENFWSVTGHHSTRFNLVNIHSSNTSATNCNLSQGWPWNYAS